MKLNGIFILLFYILSLPMKAQINPTFFPHFTANPNNPIINYGDGFADASWNDPCVLKQNGLYIMYLTAANGIAISDSNTVKVYRQISTDGINWSLSPTTPVLQPAQGTYYEGGTETPSVVYKDSTFHMYLTCYPPGNDPYEFVIAHATSSDGISWTMDATPVLESDGSQSIYGDLVGEPGAMIYNDSIYLFFTAAGTVSSQVVQSIALMKSGDGTNFNTPQIAVQMPQDVYPLIDNYWGLSTPSALAINDTIYLFTDVARTINGEWTQVALHQFKTLANSGVWYYDTLPIHSLQDFTWTDGDYLSSLLAPTPLMDDNGLLRIWYSGYHLADVNGIDTTYNIFYDSLGILHVNPDFWGIGTSSYQFPLLASKSENNNNQIAFECYPNPAWQHVMIQINHPIKNGKLTLFDLAARDVLSYEIQSQNTFSIDVSTLEAGIYFIEIVTEEAKLFGKLVVEE